MQYPTATITHDGHEYTAAVEPDSTMRISREGDEIADAEWGHGETLARSRALPDGVWDAIDDAIDELDIRPYDFLGIDRYARIGRHPSEYMEEGYVTTPEGARERAREHAQVWKMGVRMIDASDCEREQEYIGMNEVPPCTYTEDFSSVLSAWRQHGGCMTVSERAGRYAWCYGSAEQIREMVSDDADLFVETTRALAHGLDDDDEEIDRLLMDWQG